MVGEAEGLASASGVPCCFLGEKHGTLLGGLWGVLWLSLRKVVPKLQPGATWAIESLPTSSKMDEFVAQSQHSRRVRDSFE